MTTDGKDQDKARSEQAADNVSRESESPNLSEDNRSHQSLRDEIPQTEETQKKDEDSQVKTKEKSPQAAGKKTAGASSTKKIAEYQPRQISLVVSRIDPWSVMKVSFLLSVALGIAMVLAGLLVWLLLNSMSVFSSVENFINDIDPTGSIASIIDYLRLPRVMAMSTIVAVSNVILMTAFSTVGALIYNLVTSLVGGIRLALTDE